MAEPEELLKPAMKHAPSIKHADSDLGGHSAPPRTLMRGYESNEEALNRLGDPPLEATRQPVSQDGAPMLVRVVSRLGKFDEIETEEEFEAVRRKSVNLRESCSHDIVKEGNMSPALTDAVIDEASTAIVRAAGGQGWDNEIAARLKKRMDKRFHSSSGGQWHCIAGPDFGSYVSHEKGHMIYLYLPRYLAPTEKVEYQRDQRKKAEAKAPHSNSPRLPPLPQGETDDSGRPSLDLDRTGPVLGEGDMVQRMIGILLWRT